MNLIRTRQSRSKKLSKALKVVDEESRNFVTQTRIEALESDYYESPNRLAEENSEDDFEFNEDEHKDNIKKKNDQSNGNIIISTGGINSAGILIDKSIKKKPKKKLKLKRKTRKDSYLVRNLNLKKIIKEEGLDNQESKFPNFVNIKTGPPIYPPKKFCSVCGNISKYSCPRCREKYCSLKCHDAHKEIMCLKFEY